MKSAVDNALIERFLNDICKAFPEIQPRMERHDSIMLTDRMEQFAIATTEAFAQNDIATGTAYLSFMSKRLLDCSPIEHEYIDVYYVENLFWPHGTDAARTGWPHVPANLKTLFVGFHGRTPL
ncbi:DUF7674 family protein [Lysobacter antibioticus]|uniref:DUF7674 family protein n=1 Tax=Lysobacter antibioticus TaxID=84531 RepID=UPI0007E8C776|nr:hypothetical protein [Lysobacter antibioticus]